MFCIILYQPGNSLLKPDELHLGVNYLDSQNLARDLLPLDSLLASSPVSLFAGDKFMQTHSLVMPGYASLFAFCHFLHTHARVVRASTLPACLLIHQEDVSTLDLLLDSWFECIGQL